MFSFWDRSRSTHVLSWRIFWIRDWLCKTAWLSILLLTIVDRTQVVVQKLVDHTVVVQLLRCWHPFEVEQFHLCLSSLCTQKNLLFDFNFLYRCLTILHLFWLYLWIGLLVLFSLSLNVTYFFMFSRSFKIKFYMYMSVVI